MLPHPPGSPQTCAARAPGGSCFRTVACLWFDCFLPKPVSFQKLLLLGSVSSSSGEPQGARWCSARLFLSLGHSDTHWSVSLPDNRLGLPSLPAQVWPGPVDTLVEELVPVVTVAVTLKADTQCLLAFRLWPLMQAVLHYSCSHLAPPGNWGHKKCPQSEIPGQTVDRK